MKQTIIKGIRLVLILVATTSAAYAADREKPKLVLQITVDQLRGDLPMRFKERLRERGFRYLLEKGTHYHNDDTRMRCPRVENPPLSSWPVTARLKHIPPMVFQPAK